MNLKVTDVRNIFFDLISVKLNTLGFSSHKKTNYFSENSNELSQIIFFNVFKGKKNISIALKIGIRIEKISSFFQKKCYPHTLIREMKNSLNFVPEIQMNIDCFIGRCGSYVIENENDIEKACEYYFDQIISFGLPYFLKYSTYENIFQLIFGSENISKYHYFDPYSRFVLLGLLNKMLNFGENLLITFDLIEKNAKNLLDSDKFNQILEVKNEIIELELEAPVLSTSTQDRLFGDVQDEQLLNS